VAMSPVPAGRPCSPCHGETSVFQFDEYVRPPEYAARTD
jgi:hypothetical protein